MAKELLFIKKLTKTDIEKRLSVPTTKKRCFLNFRGHHMEEFMVIDNNGKAWSFGCSIRKKGYPKPVLSKGWLPFVRYWKLTIGDEVNVYRTLDKAGKGHNRIEVIRKELLPLVRNHDADKAMAVASYTDVEEEATINSNSTDQAVTYDQTEGLHNQPGLTFEFISLKPDIAVSEPKVIDFFELGSQEQREMEHPSIPTLHNINMVEIPVTSSTAPYFKFHNAERAMAVASYTDVEVEATITSDNTSQAVTYDQNKGLHKQPGLTFEFISLKPDITVSATKSIDFFELGSQEQREKEHPSIPNAT